MNPRSYSPRPGSKAERERGLLWSIARVGGGVIGAARTHAMPLHAESRAVGQRARRFHELGPEIRPKQITVRPAFDVHWSPAENWRRPITQPNRDSASLRQDGSRRKLTMDTTARAHTGPPTTIPRRPMQPTGLAPILLFETNHKGNSGNDVTSCFRSVAGVIVLSPWFAFPMAMELQAPPIQIFQIFAPIQCLFTTADRPWGHGSSSW